MERLADTGRPSELSGFDPHKENLIELKEQALQEAAQHAHSEQDSMEVNIEDISKEFKVFRDPTFAEFIEIVGPKYNPDLPLFAQLYIVKEVL